MILYLLTVFISTVVTTTVVHKILTGTIGLQISNPKKFILKRILIFNILSLIPALNICWAASLIFDYKRYKQQSSIDYVKFYIRGR